MKQQPTNDTMGRRDEVEQWTAQQMTSSMRAELEAIRLFESERARRGR